VAKNGRVLAWVWVGLVGSGMQAWAQAAAPVATPATTAAPAAVAAPMRKSCTVDTSDPNPAEEALNRKQYSIAEVLFRALLTQSADNAAAREGLVRALLAEDKVDAAAKEADGWIAMAPGNSLGLLALGDVRLRKGDPRGAFLQFQKAARADLCNARAFLESAEVDHLAGLHATEKRAIEQAYKLHPTDDDIHTAWIETRPRKERLTMLGEYAEKSKEIGDDDRTKLKESLAKQSLYHSTDCRMAPTSPREAKVPMVAITDGPVRFLGWGLDVQFNGKRRRLQIDTGASGITISRAAAMFLGIQREDATTVGGFGDKQRGEDVDCSRSQREDWRDRIHELCGGDSGEVECAGLGWADWRRCF
jgi:tetratricopeptide (TPR) repeat protein